MRNTIVVITEFKGYTVNGNSKFKVKINSIGEGYNYNITGNFLKAFFKKKLNKDGCLNIVDYRGVIIDTIEKICKERYNDFTLHNIEF
jgi:hypothetical protein